MPLGEFWGWGEKSLRGGVVGRLGALQLHALLPLCLLSLVCSPLTWKTESKAAKVDGFTFNFHSHFLHTVAKAPKTLQQRLCLAQSSAGIL